jgi:ubiquinone/menaquinone biosynthesis C-methylase UbiE
MDGGNSELPYSRFKSGQSAYFGKTARNYEQERIAEPIWQIEQDFVSTYISRIPRGNSILDVPVGTGRFCGSYHQAGLMAHCVDISLDMIAEVRTKFGLTIPGSSLSVANAMALPFADSSVDYVICWRLFHLTPRSVMKRIIKELARVTRREILLQVFSVALENTNDITRFMKSAMQSILFPIGCIRRAVTGSHKQLPWLHIKSFRHYEQDILAYFEVSNLQVLKSVTLDYYNSQPVRVYILGKRNS